jgi:hypothetical protein
VYISAFYAWQAKTASTITALVHLAFYRSGSPSRVTGIMRLFVARQHGWGGKIASWRFP